MLENQFLCRDEKCKLELGLYFLQQGASSEDSMVQNTVFRLTFLSALRTESTRVVANLLKFSFPTMLDEFSATKDQPSIMKLFISQYCQSGQMESIKNFGFRKAYEREK
jgi:hypothetical protein